MRLFHRDPPVELAVADIELTADEMQQTSLLEDTEKLISNTLDELRGLEANLHADIADATERHRHAQVAIASFEAALAITKAGKVPPAEASPEPEQTRKIGRLVPRTVKSGAS